MKKEMTRKQGTILFFCFAAVMAIVVIVGALQGNAATPSGSGPAIGGTGTASNSPPAVPSDEPSTQPEAPSGEPSPSSAPTPAPPAVDEDFHTRDDMASSVVSAVAGIYSDIPVADVISLLKGSITPRAEKQIRGILQEYDWDTIKAEKYNRYIDIQYWKLRPSTLPGMTADQVLMRLYGVTYEYSGSAAPTEVGGEYWYVVLEEKSGKWIVDQVSKMDE